MDILSRVILTIFAAAVGEGIIEFLLVPAVDLILPPGERTKGARTVILNFASAGLGVLICFGFRLGSLRRSARSRRSRGWIMR